MKLRNFLNDTNKKDTLLGLSVLFFFAALYFLFWAIYLTGIADSKILLSNPGRFFWWANDARSYQDAANWLFRISDNEMILTRPWFYPFYLGLNKALFDVQSEWVMWGGQVLMWFASIGLLYGVLLKITKKVPLAMLGATLFFTHPSPLILTFHGLTEVMNIFFLTLFLWTLTRSDERKDALLIFLLALLTVTKPTYQLQLVLFLIYWAVKNFKRIKWKTLGIGALLLIPIWIQFGLTYAYNRTLTISQIGGYTFKNYFIASLYMDNEGTNWRPTMDLIEDWDTGEQLDYLKTYPLETVQVYFDNLVVDNLLTTSFFARGEGNLAQGFTRSLNYAAVFLHIIFLPLFGYFFLSSRFTWQQKEPLLIIYGIFVIQTLVTGISAGQEDRLIITGLPLWISAYIWLLSTFFGQVYPQKAMSFPQE
jgi:hypothetical protein